MGDLGQTVGAPINILANKSFQRPATRLLNAFSDIARPQRVLGAVQRAASARGQSHPQASSQQTYARHLLAFPALWFSIMRTQGAKLGAGRGRHERRHRDVHSILLMHAVNCVPSGENVLNCFTTRSMATTKDASTSIRTNGLLICVYSSSTRMCSPREG